MRRRNLISMAVVATSAIALAPGGGASAKSKRVTELSCTIEAFQQGLPNPSAIQFGFVSCPRPLGDGVHYSAFRVTAKPAPGVRGAANGTFKNYYNRGTTSGSFALTITASSPTTLTYTGDVVYTGGTGKFKHIKGGGTIVCTTTDGGAHKLCEVNSTLTGI